MQGNFFHIRRRDDYTESRLNSYLKNKIDSLLSADKAVAVKVEEYKPPRSLSANALYWMWMSELETHFKQKGRAETKDDMHTLMRHKFLGWHEERLIGKTKIARTLRSTARLNKSEMCYYMQQVSAWAAEVGCYLTDPIESDYREFLNKQNR